LGLLTVGLKAPIAKSSPVESGLLFNGMIIDDSSLSTVEQ
jgi:hypothetical protein